MKLIRPAIWKISVFLALVVLTVAFAGQGADIWKIKRALLAEDWQTVAEECKKCDPNDLASSPVLRAIMGHACLALNQNDESLAHFLYLMNNPNREEWKKWAFDFAEKNPSNPVALYLKGDALARLGQWKQAVTVYSRALKKIDELRSSTKDPNDMTKYLKAVKKIDRKFAMALNLNARGVAYAYLKDFAKALKDLEDARLLVPDFADAHASLGAVLVAKEAPEGALAAFKEALRHSPDSALALIGRGCARYGHMDPENVGKAIQDFQSATGCASVAELAERNMTNVLKEVTVATEGSSGTSEGMSLKTDRHLLGDFAKTNRLIRHNERTLQVLPWVPDLKLGKIGWDTDRIRENTVRNLDKQHAQRDTIIAELQTRRLDVPLERGARFKDLEKERADRGNWLVKTWFGLIPNVELPKVASAHKTRKEQ